jgi:hypothetical protein
MTCYVCAARGWEADLHEIRRRMSKLPLPYEYLIADQGKEGNSTWMHLIGRIRILSTD